MTSLGLKTYEFPTDGRINIDGYNLSGEPGPDVSPKISVSNQPKPHFTPVFNPIKEPEPENENEPELLDEVADIIDTYFRKLPDETSRLVKFNEVMDLIAENYEGFNPSSRRNRAIVMKCLTHLGHPPKKKINVWHVTGIDHFVIKRS